MPSYIVKGDPSREEYVYWSTVTDAPYAWGSRAELEAELEKINPGRNAAAPERFDRADETGTSSLDGFYCWDDDTLIYDQQGVVWRDDLWALCMRLERGEDVADLLHPFEDSEAKP